MILSIIYSHVKSIFSVSIATTRISSIYSSFIGKSKVKFNIDTFVHPKLSPTELQYGTRLGIDSWADTSCAGKHAYVESFIDGRTVTAGGFSPSLGKLRDLPIANVLYAHDLHDGTTIVLENCHAIYLGDSMEDSLLNPIQAEDSGNRIDTRPKRFYPNENSQQILLSDGTYIPIHFDGVLPYIHIRRPTNNEIQHCKRVSLTSQTDWNPHTYSGTICNTNSYSEMEHIAMVLSNDPISSILNGDILHHIYDDSFLMTGIGSEGENNYTISALKSTNSPKITPSELSKLWNIGLNTAKRTLNSTTHKCFRTTGLLSRRFKTDLAQLRYKQMNRQFGTFYVDYLKSSVKSVRGYIGGSVYTNKTGFKKFFPHSDEKGISTSSGLRSFIDMIGLPSSLHTDGHNNFVEGEYRKMVRKFNIPHSHTEPHSPWQNRAEFAIGEIKKYARRCMQKTETPIRLWCYAYEYSADLLCLCATGRFDLKGRTPYETVMNSTPDISEYVTYGWFQYCWFYDENTKSKSLCRWLGPAHHVGQAFCSYLLLANGQVITRSSVIPIQDEELENDHMREQCSRFMKQVNEKIGNRKQPIYDNDKPEDIYFTAFNEDKNDDMVEYPYGNEIAEAIPEEIDEPYLESLDSYIGTKVVIPGTTPGIEPVLATIRARKRDSNGDPIGKQHENPILDTRVYQLQFPDGRVEEYSMNIIMENIANQVDDYGYDVGIFQEISGHRFNEDAIQPGPSATTSVNGREKPVITTKGCEILIKWKDQSSTWIPLSSAKESFPVQVAEYSIAAGIQNMPAFKWWVKPCLKKRDTILAKVKTFKPHRKGRMKFGVLIPSSVKEALEIDQRNGNTLWADAIEKEMANNRIAFDLLGRHEKPPPGYKKIRCHMNFEVKMDLRRKARYVAGGHLTDPPSSITYSTVVGRETVRIAFLVAALNNLSILAGDIQNAYLNAPTTEKLYFIAGPEWKADAGRPVVIVRALYGLKSSALAWRNHLADVLCNKMQFKSSLADPDLWYKAATAQDGSEYYTYILVYVDDILVIDKHPKKYMQMLQDSYTVREDTVKEPEQYLGADIGKTFFDDGTHAWTMSSASYVRNAVKNIKQRMSESGFKFNSKLSDVNYSTPQPFSSPKYRPELDTSLECNEDQIQFYQNIIGILRWLVELGRIDVAFETAVLSSYLASPRTGHLQQALHIIKYLDTHNTNELTFDPEQYHLSPSVMHEASEKGRAMSSLYPDATEEIPPNAPAPRGKAVQINCFVDADHAGDRLTRRSHTGILIYINKSPISWFSKKQTTVESSTFGSEFVALRIASEQIISLRYKLRMFGIPIEGYANVFCDNESVYINASTADSRLKKKHNSICFHRVRECVAGNIIMPFKVNTGFNLADILTKSLPALDRKKLRQMIMPSHNS